MPVFTTLVPQAGVHTVQLLSGGEQSVLSTAFVHGNNRNCSCWRLLAFDLEDSQENRLCLLVLDFLVLDLQ